MVSHRSLAVSAVTPPGHAHDASSRRGRHLITFFGNRQMARVFSSTYVATSLATCGRRTCIPETSRLPNLKKSPQQTLQRISVSTVVPTHDSPSPMPKSTLTRIWTYFSDRLPLRLREGVRMSSTPKASLVRCATITRRFSEFRPCSNSSEFCQGCLLILIATPVARKGMSQHSGI